MSGDVRIKLLSLLAGGSLVLAGCCPLGPGAAAAAPRIRWGELPSWSTRRYPPAADAGEADLPANWPEKRWSQYLAQRMDAEREVMTPDGSRADLVTTAADGSRIAWEIDFGAKWHESIGQSLFYGAALGARPGVILLLHWPQERRYYLRCLVVCAKYHIRLKAIDLDRPLQSAEAE